ncbi:MAG: hypothetical protein Kow0073_04790 [Immundisolibacter sp.]
MRCSALPFRQGLDLSDRRYFRQALETGQFAAGTYQVGRITGVPSINFGYPIRRADGQVAGVVFVAVATGWLAKLVDPAELPEKATVALLDHRLRDLMRHPASAPDAAVLPVSRAALAALIAQQPRGGPIPLAVGEGAASSRHYVYRRLGAEPMQGAPYLVLGWPPDALQTRLDAYARREPLLVLAAVSALAVVAWLTLDALIVKPLRRFAAAAARVADGEQGVRLPTPGWVAELAAMGGAFTHMVSRIDGALRAYAVLSAGNHTLLRVPSEPHLLQAMCSAVVEVGGYRCAWVSYLHENGIQTMACAGDDGGFAAYLQAHWQTALDHHTPTAQAVASAQPVMLADARRFAEHDLFAAAAGRGLLSGLVLPLKVDGRVIGVLTIHAAEANAFHERERQLLMEVADDLSLGIATARLRERERQANDRLRQLAYVDPVTGLPNQASFLEQAGTVAAGGSGSLAVLLVQVQNDWEIAATLGQGSGDAFLSDVARRLQALSPTLLARVAQSEFALLLPDADASAANREATRVLASLAPPAQLAAVSVDIRATVGIAVGEAGPGDETARLLQAAKLAAHEAAGAASPVLLAQPELDKVWRDRLTLAADLRAAIDNRALRVYLQPQLDLRSGQICGMEALARWHHPRHGEVSPARFIDLAEKTGLIRPLTDAILDRVYELAVRHAAVGLRLPVAVNISARNLHDPEFVDRVTGLLERWPLPRACLHLELTETAAMDDPARSLKALQQLHGLGLAIYLDDFGTGHSSMAYLRELPISGLKIDRTFTIGLGQPDTRRIVQAMIDLGHALGLKVVAEGAQDEATLAILADLGCDIAQGYGIARPMPQAEMAAWVERWPGLPTAGAPNGDA